MGTPTPQVRHDKRSIDILLLFGIGMRLTKQYDILKHISTAPAIDTGNSNRVCFYGHTTTCLGRGVLLCGKRGIVRELGL